MNADTPITPDRIMQLGFGFWASKTLLSAVELELFTELGKQSEDLDAISRRLGLHTRSSRDFLDSLVSLGLLERTDGIYSNTAETDLFLDKNKPSYIGGILEMANHRLYPFWAHLTEALRTGRPQNESKNGENVFEAIYADPARLKEFLKSMSGVSHGSNMAIAAKFPWDKYKSYVDVGTAQGDLAAQVALQNKHLKGIGFDLPPVEPVFEDYIKDLGLADRVSFHGGDFFQESIPNADVVLMGHILHDWNLEEKMLLLRKAFDAVPEGGAVVVYEAIIDDDRRQNSFGLMLSLNMLIETPGGFDFTGADCTSWMKEVGFKEVKIEPLTGPDSMVVGIK